MSEDEPQAPPQVLLRLDDGSTYDLGPLGEVLAWARDFAIGRDIANAAANLSQMRPSPLVRALDGALGTLRDLVERPAAKAEDVPASPA